MTTRLHERQDGSEQRAQPRPAPPPPRREALDAAGVLALQRTLGNAGVNALLSRKVTATVDQETPGADTSFEAWSEDEAKAIQKELKRLNLYPKLIDGIIGTYSKRGLTEAFGGEEWRTMAAGVCLERLRAATKVKPPGKGHDFEYGELFKDGVLDITFGMGYMEEEKGEYMTKLAAEFDAAFTAKGYKQDDERAAEIMTAAGRAIGKEPFGKFWVKENALTYGPPAGEQRSVHVVVRFVSNESGTKGAQAAGAFREAMTGGDVAYYSGHGRYGSGPDFDRNFLKFTLTGKDGTPQVIDDYSVLEKELRKEGDPWKRFLERYEDGSLKVDFSNVGNVRLNKEVHHAKEFGGKLIYWAMDKTGTAAETGTGGALAKGAAAHPERRYRVLVFDGCRTQDYEKAVRATPGFDTKGADVVETTRTVGFHAEVEAFMAFLDGVVGQQSAEEVIKGMNSEMAKHESGKRKGAAFAATGLKDNPAH